MSTALVQPINEGFTREKIELIKSMVAKDCSDDELQLFLYTCKKTGLDPLARQIYAIKRGGKMTIQTGIDGYRVIADRTGRLAGITDYSFDSEDGKNPKKATVTVKKLVEPGSGLVADFTATARWEEYQAGGPMWAKMPYLMLGKCAEALALRKAFPADLSGVYTAEEMAQADNGQAQAEVYAEVERQKSSPSKNPTGPELTGVLQASVAQETAKLTPEQRAAEDRNKLAQDIGTWSIDGNILHCKIIGIQKKKKRDGVEFLSVTFNGRLPNGANFASVFDTELYEALNAGLDKEVKLKIAIKGAYVNIENVLWIQGVSGPEPLSFSDTTREPLFEGA